jgi:hypothetical protein
MKSPAFSANSSFSSFDWKVNPEGGMSITGVPLGTVADTDTGCDLRRGLASFLLCSHHQPRLA